MLTFTAHGQPVTKGNLRSVIGFVRGKGWRARTFDKSPRTQAWQTVVRDAAAQARARDGRADVLWPKPHPVRLSILFLLPCPIRLRKRADTPPTAKPDLDKLTRLVGDALTGIAYTDDSQIVELYTRKRYVIEGERWGAVVSVQRWEGHCASA